MDFNKLIEDEVQLRCEAYKKELEQQYEEYKKEYAKQFKNKMCILLENIRAEIIDFDFEKNTNSTVQSKCQYFSNKCFCDSADEENGLTSPSTSTCNNSTVNKKCDFPSCKNYRDGSVDDICRECDSYIIKQKKDSDCKENLKNSAATKNTTFKESVADMVNKHEEAKRNESSNKKLDKKSIDSLYTALEPLLKIYGITRDDFNQAKIFTNNSDIVSRLSGLLERY